MPPKEKRKLSHLFYVCYMELCKKQNLQPLSLLKSTGANSNSNNNKAILDICIDRIKYEEWGPILNALSHDNSLHFVAFRCRQHPKKINEQIDTESKIRQASSSVRIVAATKFLLSCLIDAIVSLLSQSQYISVLILEGLPLSVEFVQNLARGLGKNKTLQHLNLQHCLIGDSGCEILSRTLRYVSNILTLDLSNCNLTANGVKHLSELIKYQKISRYSESWKQTLRYREPDLENMRGLRRLTVNNNPNIGDEGLLILIEVLKDDLWMKAIDFQNCGVTNNGAEALASLLAFNGIIDIADIRKNNVSQQNLQNIMMLLCKNCPMDTNNENRYQWLNTTSTLTDNGLSSHSQLISTNSNPQLQLNLSSSGTRTIKFEDNLKRSNSPFPIGKQSSDTNTTISSRKPRDVWSPVKIPAIVECKQSVADQLKEAKSKIRELQMQLEEVNEEKQRVDSLNIQLHSQLMEVIGRPGGIGDGDIPNRDGFVYVKKEILSDIYTAFGEVYNSFSMCKSNGVNKVKGHSVFNKLQSIIEESPCNSRENTQETYRQSPRKVNSSGDMQFSHGDRQNIMTRGESAPRAQHLFNALLSGDDGANSAESDYDETS